MPAQCLSCLGPPPGCGHQPTPDKPVCDGCALSYENYVARERDMAIRAAKAVLAGRGFLVLEPLDLKYRDD